MYSQRCSECAGCSTNEHLIKEDDGRYKLPRICGGFLNLTQQCNLGCTYCFVVQQPKRIDLQTAKDAVDFYANNALEENLENNTNIIPSVTLFGGEPMLRYDDIIVPLVEYIRETYGDYHIDITTNGTLLNREVYEFFKKHDVGMLLSIDGDITTQNKQRPYHGGKGTFSDIDVEMHLEYYPDAIFRATLDPGTVEYLYDNYLWGERQGYQECTFVINSFGDWTEEYFKELRKQLYMIRDHIKMAIYNNEPYMTFTEIDRHDMNYEILTQLEEAGDFDFYRNIGIGMPASGRCGLGGSIYGSIGSSGNIYSCQEMSENPECDDFIIGNIYTGMDDEARNRVAWSFDPRNVVSSKIDRCSTCTLNRICVGECTINNYFKYGSLNIVDESVCEYSEITYEIYVDIEEFKMKLNELEEVGE